MEILCSINISLYNKYNSIRYYISTQNQSPIKYNRIQSNIPPYMNIFQQQSTSTPYPQSFKILQHYFQVEFDLSRLQVHYPSKKTSELEETVRNQIRDILIDIQNQLFVGRQIHCLKFGENYTVKMYREFGALYKILDERSKNTFIEHYRNRINQITEISATISKTPLLNPLKNHPLLQIPLQNKLYLYQQFLHYALKKNLFQAPIINSPINSSINPLLNSSTSTHLPVSSPTSSPTSSPEQQDPTKTKVYQDQLLDMGYIQQIESVYSLQQLHVIYNCYIKMKGRLNQILYQTQGRGLKGYKFSQKVLMFKLENIKLIGLYEIYKNVFGEIDGIALNWRQFKEIYGDIFVNWEQSVLEKLIRIAIYKDPDVKEGREIVLKIGRSYLSRYQGFNMRLKTQKFMSFSFRSTPTAVNNTKENGVLSTIKNQMRKLLLVNNSNNNNSNSTNYDQ